MFECKSSNHHVHVDVFGWARRDGDPSNKNATKSLPFLFTSLSNSLVALEKRLRPVSACKGAFSDAYL